MKYFIFLILSLNALSIFCEESLLFNEDLQYSQVEFVQLTENSLGNWKFNVTIRHDDSGWDHYADLWVVVNPQTDEVLGSRTLAHPHVGEQPFTRTLSGVIINKEIRYLEVKSKCTLHGYQGKAVLVDLTQKEGTSYKVLRLNSKIIN